jgi:hypothetical protein
LSAFHEDVLPEIITLFFHLTPKPRLDAALFIWSGPIGGDIFEFRYRFRRNHFILVLPVMDLVDTCGTFKELLLGNAGHQWPLRFDTAFMTLLRYLAYPGPARSAIASTNST